MKRISLILCLTLIACSQNNTTHIGETHMSKILNVYLEENLNDKNITAVVSLNASGNIPVDYQKAELLINDIVVAEFNNGQATYQPQVFGDIDVFVRFTTATGIEKIADTITLQIETWFLQYNSSENGDTKEPIEGGNIVLTPSNVTLGSSDMIWMYNVRVPYGKDITFNYISEKLTDNAPNFGQTKLDVHFRYDDYENRFDLYPDEPYVAKYIDTETDKWVSPPVTLSHGTYNLYVCPNEGADKSYITVTHSGDRNGSFSANYKSIVRWPSR